MCLDNSSYEINSKEKNPSHKLTKFIQEILDLINKMERKISHEQLIDEEFLIMSTELSELIFEYIKIEC